MRKPVVGETLYSLNVGNAAWRREQNLTPVVVTAVGRKYFTVGEGHLAVRYHLEDWSEKTDCSPTSKLYETPQEWEDEKEAGRLSKAVYAAFERGRNRRGLSLDTLRKIVSLVEKDG